MSQFIRYAAKLTPKSQSVPQHRILKCFVLSSFHCGQVPEFGSWFLVELYQVGAGAMINDSGRFANITVVESDSPQGLLLFAVGSRLPVVHQKSTLLSLQVVRESSTSSLISVSYRMQVSQSTTFLLLQIHLCSARDRICWHCSAMGYQRRPSQLFLAATHQSMHPDFLATLAQTVFYYYYFL